MTGATGSVRRSISIHLLQEYVALSFSADGKLIIAQGGPPEWNLILWVWEKGKQSASIKPSTNQQPFPICQVRFGVASCPPWGQLCVDFRPSSRVQALFHPQDPSLVSVIGNGLFRAFRCTDTALKPQSNGLMKREVQVHFCPRLPPSKFMSSLR